MRILGQRKILKTRFHLDLSKKECSNAIYAAYKNQVRIKGRNLILDNDTTNHIIKAAQWLRNPSYPGLLMRGDVGNGKTTLMHAIIDFIEFYTEMNDGYSSRSVVKFYTAKQIARMVTTEEGRKSYENLIKTPMLAIDELGEEPPNVMVYGMIYEPLKDLLQERYTNRDFTILTTNLKSSKLQEVYSRRVMDRFMETMEIIDFTNPSYRQRKDNN